MSLNPISLNRDDSYLIMNGDGNILFHVTSNDSNQPAINSVNMFITLKFEEHQSKVRRYCILEKILQRKIQKEKIGLLFSIGKYNKFINYYKLLLSNKLCNNFEFKTCESIEQFEQPMFDVFSKSGILNNRGENFLSVKMLREILSWMIEIKNETINILNNLYTNMYEEYLAELSQGDADSMRWGRSGNVSKYKPYTYKKIPSILDTTITNDIIRSIDVLKEFNTFTEQVESKYIQN